ncbi:MAG TPA: hypothetical protein VIU12_11845 [Chryseolinea sp.]
MNARTRQYLFGFIFFAVGIYQLTRHDALEASLYMAAGTAFVFNSLAMEPRLIAYKKGLAIVTWVLIIGTGLLLLWLVQFKYL